MSDKKINLISFLIIIAGALLVRLYGLSDYYFNEDESWHLTVANQKTFFDVIWYNFQQEIHPPLSYLIWHAMLQISENDLWLRMSSILPGILLIPSGYAFGRLYLGKAAGWTIAFIFAFGILPTSLSTIIRAYSPLMLALVWMAIFVQRYSAKPFKKKYLIYYHILALIAIELHHGAAFPLLAFGSLLLLQAFRDKNKKDFLIIASTHFLFAVIVISYPAILVKFFNFTPNYGYFVKGGGLVGNIATYLTQFLYLFLFFILSEINGYFPIPQFLLLITAIITTFVSLIRKKNWRLLYLVFAPFAALCLTDYFGFYPFSHVVRNNLFLCISLMIIYGYFAQMICDSLRLNFQPAFKPLFALLTTVWIVVIFFQNNFFRAQHPSCAEFSVSKSDRDFLYEKLAQKESADNIFVTVQHSIWDLQFVSNNHDKIKILTKNLAKFQNDKITVYFGGFPGRKANLIGNLSGYNLFFTDLFKHLKSTGTFYKTKSITYFDLGLKSDYMHFLFHPIFIKKPDKQFSQENYDFMWAIQSSKQVLNKIYKSTPNTSCGRRVMLFSFTPKFVQDEILAVKNDR